VTRTLKEVPYSQKRMSGEGKQGVEKRRQGEGILKGRFAAKPIKRVFKKKISLRTRNDCQGIGRGVWRVGEKGIKKSEKEGNTVEKGAGKKMGKRGVLDFESGKFLLDYVSWERKKKGECPK